MCQNNTELVFISANSEDFDHADKVYEFLRRRGINVFFSYRSLPELGNSDYRRVIDQKLDQCDHMVVVASSRRRVESAWVEAEWGFFINAKRTLEKEGNIVTVAVGNLTPKQLPPSLRFYEVIPLREDSLEKIIKYVGQVAVGESEETHKQSIGFRFDTDDSSNCAAAVKVFGIGGSGRSVIDLIVDQKSRQMITVHVSTDTQSVESSKADVKILIGAKSVTLGLGSGDEPGPARKAAEIDRAIIAGELTDCDLVFLSTGLGGGTGTGATPVIAELSRSMGILTICVASMPFGFEGRLRIKRANDSLKELQQKCDVVIPLFGEKLISNMAPEATFSDPFQELAGLQHRYINAFGSIFLQQGIVNIDMADLRSIFFRAGLGGIGQGMANGENRAEMAVRSAMSSGYYSDLDIRRAQSVALVLEYGSDLGLNELVSASETIYEICNDEVRLMFNQVVNEDLGDSVRATVVVVGLT